jgi:gamma-glutamylcyclotransferase (GGCT)/AIG2-like uncharacterized protein YtfP
MPLVFVYGTLKTGGSNHRYLEGQRLVGPARTEAAYRLHLLDGYPGMVAAPAGGRSIEGELWEVDRPALERLDRLEGTDSGLYARARIRLRPPHEALNVETYVYQRRVEGKADLGTRFEG